MGDKIIKNIEDKKIDQLKNVIIYGELCGYKIQNGGNYFPDRKFIVFDIYDFIDNKFFTWSEVKHFANDLGLETVPEIKYDKEDLNVNNVREFILGLKSVYNANFDAEGIVVRYIHDTTNVKRWMAKIRKKDFKK
jgi:ATP-dependent RNA circularization protein (DNA/RNA ligase family)